MNPSPNLFLIGPMGAGKSSLGRHLARHFGLPCLDLDTEIEAHTGAGIPTIFELEGEAGFRRRESERLAHLAAREGIVLATGGGTVLAPDNRALLRSRGFVVWLATGIDQQLARLARDRARPLLAAPDRRAKLEQLARERDPLYRETADLVFENAAETAQQAAARLAARLEGVWHRTPATQATA